MITKGYLKVIIVTTLAFIGKLNKSFSQDIPTIITTSHINIRFGVSGQEEINPIIQKACYTWSFESLGQKIINYMPCNEVTPKTLKIIEVFETQRSQSGNWSKKMLCFDPLAPNYLSNGTLIGDHVLTIIYDGVSYSVIDIFSVFEKSSGNVISSTAMTHYNFKHF